MVNAGKIPLKVRKSKKDNIQAHLEQARKKQVILRKSLSVKGKTGYNAISVQRWKDTHEGEAPQESGLKTCFKIFEGKLEEVVLVRKKPVGEWDVEIEDGETMEEKEEVDKSELVVQNSQLKKRAD